MNSPNHFYDSAYKGDQYAASLEVESHFAFDELKQFCNAHDLFDQRCLEIGSGRGAFQGIVTDYTGVDLSKTVAANYSKPFFTASAEDLPFDDCEFDALWSITVLEHVPNPQTALEEMRRVLRPGGLIFLKPAWNCRSWNCEGIPVRGYRELNFRQKITKFALPVRDSIAFRAACTLPVRLWRTATGGIGEKHELAFRKLNADYSTFWMADSDACSSIDPFSAIQWFQSQGDSVLSHRTWIRGFLSRSEPLVVRVNK